ncbi:MAG: glycosyltransferase family 4 protein [Firmicutes bacterium]|nr:glycosyltransferase family 4 protein [Bacillota bacterium]
MNILLLFSHPWKFGGGETYVLSLAKGLVEREHNVVLVTGLVNSDLQVANVHHYQLPFRTKNPFKYFTIYQQLKQVLLKHDINIIHAQYRTAGYYGAMIKRKMGIPFVLTLHDDWHNAPFKSIHGKLFKHVIAVSEAIREQFIRKFVAEPKNVVTIYNGVDEKKFNDKILLKSKAEDFKKRFGILPKEKVITLLGRIRRAKGHFDLIDALDYMKSCSIPFRFLIVGDGPEKEDLLNRVVEKGLSDKVVFAGYQSDVPVVMTATDILVLPSYREAMPLSIIEAMLVQKPVIASAVGGIVEIIEPNYNGVLIQPGSPQQLAEEIIKLLENPILCDQLGRAGYETAMAGYTIDNMVDSTMSYYEAVCKEDHE